MLQHALVRAGRIVHQGVAVIAAQLQLGQHGAVRPAVDHLAPIGVGGLGVIVHCAVQILQHTGVFLKALGVLQQEDVGLAAAGQFGAQPGDAGHLVVGVGAFVLGVKIDIVGRNLHHDLAVPVLVLAEGGQRVLQGIDGIDRQLVGAYIGDLHIGPGLKDRVLDDPTAEENGGNADHNSNPMVVPPVGGLFGLCIFARGLRRLVVGFGAVLRDPCHSVDTLLL